MPSSRFTIRQLMIAVAAWGLACGAIVALARSGETKLSEDLTLAFIVLNLGVVVYAATGLGARRVD